MKTIWHRQMLYIKWSSAHSVVANPDWSGVKVFEYVPSFNGNSRPRKHLVPMPHFIRTTSAAYHDPADQFIGPNVVMVHHWNGKSCPPDSFACNIKHKRLIEARLRCSLLCLCLLLLYFLTIMQQPDLHVRVWTNKQIHYTLYTQYIQSLVHRGTILARIIVSPVLRLCLIRIQCTFLLG